MAKILVIDKKHYLGGGLAPLRRGDRWVIDAKIVDRLGTYETPVDLTGVPATGFFPAADAEDTDAAIAVSGTILNAEAGTVRFTVEPEETDLVSIADQGVSMYATLATADGLQTVETNDSPFEIKDRGFNQF